MLLCRYQNAGQIPDIKIANRFFENVGNNSNKSKFDPEGN
jgi:hypothetical protein